MLLFALQSIDNVSDVSEFRYKQTLTLQHIQTLLHAVEIAQPAHDSTLLSVTLRKHAAALVHVLEREEYRSPSAIAAAAAAAATGMTDITRALTRIYAR